jgi:hypothetical protein
MRQVLLFHLIRTAAQGLSLSIGKSVADEKTVLHIAKLVEQALYFSAELLIRNSAGLD